MHFQEILKKQFLDYNYRDNQLVKQLVLAQFLHQEFIRKSVLT